MNQYPLFLTVADPATWAEVRLMHSSLRNFGGELRTAPFWIFSAEPGELASLQDPHSQIIPLHLSGREKPYLFERKVTACARAEQMASRGTGCLVWVDPGVVFTAPPVEFLLQTDYDAAFRPVHIRNVGLPSSAPLDSFWRGICTACGVEDVPGQVTSFVDGQEIRTYFNTHAFSIQPGLGLMQEWLKLFHLLIQDVHFQSEACGDEAHQVFLFQALLGTLVASRLDQARIKLLPPTYNYPYNLQDKIPAGKRLDTLNSAVCFVYEDLSVHPDDLHEISVHGPFKDWLKTHVPR